MAFSPNLSRSRKFGPKETGMRSRFAIGHRPAKRPDFVFAALIVFVILLIGLVHAIDLLTANGGGTIG
jgi:hypothetical protein